MSKSGVAVEKLFSRDFTNEIRSQVIESSFAAGAEIHGNYLFGSFFNSPRQLHSLKIVGLSLQPSAPLRMIIPGEVDGLGYRSFS